MKKAAVALLALSLAGLAGASNPPDRLKLNIDGEETKFMSYFMPAWDYDGGGCYPSVLVGTDMRVNGGLDIGGHRDGQCRDLSDIDNSNVYGRLACYAYGSNGRGRKCAMYYGLYFEKDQIGDGYVGVGKGHTHDVEHIVMYADCPDSCDNVTQYDVTHIGTSSHGKLILHDADRYAYETRIQGIHPRIVYHQRGGETHSVRPAGDDEKAENITGAWHFPILATWNEMEGGPGVSNNDLNNIFNGLDLGGATPSMNNRNIVGELNKKRPSGYDRFTLEHANYYIANEYPDGVKIPTREYRSIRNLRSGLCLGVPIWVVNHVNVQVGKCKDHSTQRWRYDPVTKEFRNQNNGAFACLDHGGNPSGNVYMFRCDNAAASNQEFLIRTRIGGPFVDRIEGEIRVSPRVSTHNYLDIDGAGSGSYLNVDLDPHEGDGDRDKGWFWEEFAGNPPPLSRLHLVIDGGETKFMSYFMPAWDYDDGSCYPSVLVGSDKRINRGHNLDAQDGQCRDLSHIDNSNVYGRLACYAYGRNGAGRKCAMYYGLYFEKDQASGHKHDVEYIVMYADCPDSCNDVTKYDVTHIGTSSEGDLIVRDADDYAYETRIQGIHPRIVSHQQKLLPRWFGDLRKAHSVLRPAGDDEHAENITGAWHFPILATWNEMGGKRGVANNDLKNILNRLDLGSATPSMNDSFIERELNKNRPSDYDHFALEYANYYIADEYPGGVKIPTREYRSIRNLKSGLCLGIQGSRVDDFDIVQVERCNDDSSQRWKYDPVTKEFRNQNNGAFACLDHGGDPSGYVYMFRCDNAAASNQEFLTSIIAPGTFGSATEGTFFIKPKVAPTEYLGPNGTSSGSNVDLDPLGSDGDKAWFWEEFKQ